MPKNNRPKVNDALVAVRVPSELRAAYEAWAIDETRSMSQQILHVLRAGLPPERRVAEKPKAASPARPRKGK